MMARTDLAGTRPTLASTTRHRNGVEPQVRHIYSENHGQPGGPMARTKKYTDGQIIAALEATHGLIYQAARKVGCHADTIYHRSRSSPAIQETLQEERGQLAPPPCRAWAVMFVLRTLGMDRGNS